MEQKGDKINKVFKFTLKSEEGVKTAYEECANAAMNQSVPNQNITNAVRSINGVPKLAELKLRYFQWVSKITGDNKVRPIQLLE